MRSRPPNGVLTMVSTLATKTHRTLHHMETDETMVGCSRDAAQYCAH